MALLFWMHGLGLSSKRDMCRGLSHFSVHPVNHCWARRVGVFLKMLKLFWWAFANETSTLFGSLNACGNGVSLAFGS